VNPLEVGLMDTPRPGQTGSGQEAPPSGGLLELAMSSLLIKALYAMLERVVPTTTPATIVEATPNS
jgi:hypothetical protein